jgi:hypothetical protein
VGASGGSSRSGSSQDEAAPNPGQQQNVQPEREGVQVAMLRSMSNTRIAKFNRLLGEQVVDLDALRELSWSGIPPALRPTCWRLLLGYLPPNRERREQILARKRREYRDMVPDYYDLAASGAEQSGEELGALRQARGSSCIA